jgi:hypothetical protein
MTTPTTEGLRALLATVTPGPWKAFNDHGGALLRWRIGGHSGIPSFGLVETEDQAALIVAAINALPSLLDTADRVRGLEEAVERAAGWFEEYAHSHAAKEATEGDRKSAVNAFRAQECRAALQIKSQKDVG